MPALLALFVSVAATLALVQSPAPADPWKTYRFAEYGFAADFPAQPVQGPAKDGSVRWLVEIDNGWKAYLVNCVDITEERARTRSSDGILDDAVEGGLRVFTAPKVQVRRPISLGGNPGRELTIDVDYSGAAMRVATRTFLVHRRIYIVTAVHRINVDEESAQRFLKSFALIAR